MTSTTYRSSNRLDTLQSKSRRIRGINFTSSTEAQSSNSLDPFLSSSVRATLDLLATILYNKPHQQGLGFAVHKQLKAASARSLKYIEAYSSTSENWRRHLLTLDVVNAL
ncbi:hypothetical protein HNY73_009034 [Argiope bruennichi]|uniref:Uncharacterized protein n=1 Tax=Argiope bruennichi TaxID=94029 RepID=A0A8T0F8B1_ARGBR|nr:hypothetical protein HNY73_009034 [Argiope bruennichi]